MLPKVWKDLLFYLKNICSTLTIDLRVTKEILRVFIVNRKSWKIHYFCHFEKFRTKYKIVVKYYYYQNVVVTFRKIYTKTPMLLKYNLGSNIYRSLINFNVIRLIFNVISSDLIFFYEKKFP